MPENFHFTAEIDFACLRDTIALVRQGNLVDNRHILIDHAAHLLGGVNAYVADMNQPPVIGNAQLESIDNETLESVTEKVESQLNNDQQPEAAASFGMNPILAALIKKMIQLLLEQLL